MNNDIAIALSQLVQAFEEQEAHNNRTQNKYSYLTEQNKESTSKEFQAYIKSRQDFISPYERAQRFKQFIKGQNIIDETAVEKAIERDIIKLLDKTIKEAFC